MPTHSSNLPKIVTSLQKGEKFSIDARPLHLRLEEAMDMLLKEYSPGDRLPSEEELSKLMGVSRASIRECLRALEERGRIVRQQGVGTFIAPNKPLIESGLEILESLDAFAQRMGLICEMRDLKICEERADKNEAEKLNVEIGSHLTVVTRTRAIQDTMVAYIYDAMPASIANAEDLLPGFSGSVLDYLEKNTSPGPQYAKTTLLAIQANKDIASKMRVPRGSSLLMLEETLYSIDDQVLNYSRRYYNTKYFHYHILRRKIA
jgi:GntR family transcriptional regulator